ncbi:MAG: histidine kinase dimerization/phosphoacceptor domain -containing protein, partial [Methylococcales bacterium]
RNLITLCVNWKLFDDLSGYFVESFQSRLTILRGFKRFETIYRCKNGDLVDVEVNMAYLYEKKQLFSFVRDITQRKQAEKLRIKQLEQQRDILVQEVHHRIKNHLQGLLGLLNLYSYKKPSEKDFIDDITAKINSIAVVYGLQSRKNQHTAFLCEITSEICKSMEIFSIGELDYCFDGLSRALLQTEYTVPVALIINELIINAVKHSRNSPSKRVAVHLILDEKSATLTVQNHCRNQTDFPDFAQGIGLGLGLSLVQAMLPLEGVHLTLTQKNLLVCGQLYLEAPIVSIQAV